MINFKKISAITASVLMASMTLGVAAAANYPAPFVDGGVADVAIVYGTGVGVSNLDSIEAGSIQTSLAGSMPTTGSISVDGGEAFALDKSSDHFNFNEDLNDIYTDLDKDQMDFLADGTYDDGNIDEEYEQKIVMGTSSNKLMLFSDSDYADSEPTVGFYFTDEQVILRYEMEYDSAINFTAMEDTNLPLFGAEYYVLDVTGTTILELLDTAEKAIIQEGSSITVGGKVVTIEYIDTNDVKLNIDGESTDKLGENEEFELADGSYVVITENLYAEKEAGVSKAEFAIGDGLMKLESGEEIEINDEKEDGVYATFTGGADLTKIAIEWRSHKDTFLTEANSLTMPGFDSISLAFGGLDVSDAEEIVFSSGDTLELQMDNFDIPLMNSESTLIYLGEDGNYLVTATSTELNYTDNAGYEVDNSTLETTGLTLWEGDRFIVTALADDNSDIEQEYYEVTSIDYTSSTDAELELEDLIGDNDLSFDEVEDIDRGEFNFEILGMNATSVYLNVSAGTDTVTFNKIVSDTGAVITIEALARATAATISTSALSLREADEEEDVNAGATVTIGVTNSSNDKLYATVANSGTVTKEETTDDSYVGYVESVMASKINTDESGDEYSLSIEYSGVEATADVQVVAGGTISTTESEALGGIVVKDTEVSSVSDKNLIIVGGSCINSAAANVLGGAYCGAAFTEATGIGSGQWLIKSVSGAYTEGKIALVVAGYDVADTVNAATYLRTKTVDTSKDWTGTTSLEATQVVE